jgi:hypothetical protein
MEVATTRSKIWRSISLSRKRPSRSTENVEWCCRENIDPSQQVIRRDHLVEAKLVKQLPLISVLPPHHRRLFCRFLSGNHCSFRSSIPFSTASTRNGCIVRCLHCGDKNYSRVRYEPLYNGALH